MKKHFQRIALAALMVAANCLTTGAQSLSPNIKWHGDKGTIVTESPQRPAGQQHVLGLLDSWDLACVDLEPWDASVISPEYRLWPCVTM